MQRLPMFRTHPDVPPYRHKVLGLFQHDPLQCEPRGWSHGLAEAHAQFWDETARSWHDVFCSPAPADDRLERVAYRMFRAAQMIRESVDVDPDVRSGVPVLHGTRFTIAQVMAQLAVGDSILGISEEFDLDIEDLKRCLECLSAALDRPMTR